MTPPRDLSQTIELATSLGATARSLHADIDRHLKSISDHHDRGQLFRLAAVLNDFAHVLKITEGELHSRGLLAIRFQK
jgi:hypothetical protein